MIDAVRQDTHSRAFTKSGRQPPKRHSIEASEEGRKAYQYAAAIDPPWKAIEDREEVEAALRGLTLKQRRVLIDRFMLGLDAPELGDRDGLSTGTVASRTHYALKHAKELRGHR
jgi:DNA-directed RNA polymerase specialized sigma24 family protein